MRTGDFALSLFSAVGIVSRDYSLSWRISCWMGFVNFFRALPLEMTLEVEEPLLMRSSV